jgi:hypothetical protein
MASASRDLERWRDIVADEEIEEITASDHAQLGTEPVGVYLSQDDALQIVEILQSVKPTSSINEEIPRLIKLLEECETAEAALHVTIAE